MISARVAKPALFGMIPSHRSEHSLYCRVLVLHFDIQQALRCSELASCSFHTLAFVRTLSISHPRDHNKIRISCKRYRYKPYAYRLVYLWRSLHVYPYVLIAAACQFAVSSMAMVV